MKYSSTERFNFDNKKETNPNKLQYTAEKLDQHDQRMPLSLGDRCRIVKMIILQQIQYYFEYIIKRKTLTPKVSPFAFSR